MGMPNAAIFPQRKIPQPYLVHAPPTPTTHLIPHTQFVNIFMCAIHDCHSAMPSHFMPMPSREIFSSSGFSHFSYLVGDVRYDYDDVCI